MTEKAYKIERVFNPNTFSYEDALVESGDIVTDDTHVDGSYAPEPDALVIDEPAANEAPKPKRKRRLRKKNTDA